MRNRTAAREDGRRVRRALRVAVWNAALIAAGLALLAATGELWLRNTVPFITRSVPRAFIPGVGGIGRPGAEVRVTNQLDFWQVSRFNRQGFLDREPPHAEPAADACHVTVIGDSFVEALQVPIADKLHVRLEVLARRLSGLHVTTSAFGRSSTGQIAQLAYYDEFARKRRPRLIVLVFVSNDYLDNSPLLTALLKFRDPDRLPIMTAERVGKGALRLRPPNPDHKVPRLDPRHRGGIMRYVRAVTRRAARWSYFGGWLDAQARARTPREAVTPRMLAWADILRKKHPDEPLLDTVARREWPVGMRLLRDLFAADPLPPSYAAELEYTAFALEQFRRRADRDGASLVILATHHLRPGEPLFDRLRAIAGELRIPVVSQYDHIVRRGGRVRDAHWRHDYHWTPAGHQWAAEAILEHLRRRPDVCARGPRRTPAPGGGASAGDGRQPPAYQPNFRRTATRSGDTCTWRSRVTRLSGSVRSTAPRPAAPMPAHASRGRANEALVVASRRSVSNGGRGLTYRHCVGRS